MYTSSDLFTLYVDPYHDRRSGFFFGINAAGTLYDGVLYNDDWDDNSWDGVWEGKAQIDEHGWVLEMRIPYSQLRFHEADVHVWGVNFRREIARRNEVDYYVLRPKNASGFVSRFADLVGIERITPPIRTGGPKCCPSPEIGRRNCRPRRRTRCSRKRPSGRIPHFSRRCAGTTCWASHSVWPPGSPSRRSSVLLPDRLAGLR